MAETVMRIVFRFLGIVLPALLVPLAAVAEGLADPTRPPPGLAGAAGTGEAAGAQGPVLQSVLISGGRKSAIIGGQVVGLGEKYGDARVVKITESEVVLQSGATKEVLRLFPDVDKRQVRSAGPRQVTRGKPAGNGEK